MLVKQEKRKLSDNLITHFFRQTRFLTVETVCPKGFGLNTYTILMDEQGNTYRVSINSENGYVGQIYLAPGTYVH